MIFLIHGEDKPASRAYLTKVMGRYEPGEIKDYIHTDTPLEEIITYCETKPMFSDKRLLLIEGKLERSLKPKVLEYLGKLPDYTDVALWLDYKVPRTDALSKKVTFLKGENREFNENVIEDIFPFLDETAKKNYPLALTKLQKLKEASIDPGYIFNMLVWEFRNLAMVKFETQESKNIHPFVKNKLKKYAQNYTRDELISCYNNLQALDLKLKTGQVEPTMVVEYFIYTLNNS